MQDHAAGGGFADRAASGNAAIVEHPLGDTMARLLNAILDIRWRGHGARSAALRPRPLLERVRQICEAAADKGLAPGQRTLVVRPIPCCSIASLKPGLERGAHRARRRLIGCCCRGQVAIEAGIPARASPRASSARSSASSCSWASARPRAGWPGPAMSGNARRSATARAALAARRDRVQPAVAAANRGASGPAEVAQVRRWRLHGLVVEDAGARRHGAVARRLGPLGARGRLGRRPATSSRAWAKGPTSPSPTTGCG